jgi:DNA-binding response OmpR family regulator
MPSVLIADDDQRLLKMLCRTLTYEGLDVITAADGKRALELAYAQHPDVIVLDWMMPEQNGLGVLAALREDRGPRAGAGERRGRLPGQAFCPR